MDVFEEIVSRSGLRVLGLPEWEDKLPGLSVGFTVRDGGVSKPPLGGLNCALHVGDDEQAVIHNRRIVAEAAEFAFDDWTCAEQTHGSHVRAVGSEERGTGRRSAKEAFAATDGLVTDEPGVMLTACYADCVPLYFVDPAARAIGLAHAGWRGTAANIAARTIEAMVHRYGSRPEQMLAAIGPSIGLCCYEVGEDVARELGLPVVPAGNSRYMPDLKEINRQFMIGAGIQPKNIARSGYCTSCRTDLFFSHRAEKGVTGRMTAWIGWKDEVKL